ncbi:UNVERIFIED_CONTAM: hypothetical protein K2H54_012935 [Gekko kuhli]
MPRVRGQTAYHAKMVELWNAAGRPRWEDRHHAGTDAAERASRGTSTHAATAEHGEDTRHMTAAVVTLTSTPAQAEDVHPVAAFTRRMDGFERQLRHLNRDLRTLKEAVNHRWEGGGRSSGGN